MGIVGNEEYHNDPRYDRSEGYKIIKKIKMPSTIIKT